jgi:uncharacterized protein (TIGR02246 family)
MTQSTDPGVQVLLDNFITAWNAHDVDALTRCWAESGNIVHPWGHYAAGHEEIRALLGDEHASGMGQSRQELQSVRSKFLSDNTVVLECDATIDDVKAPNGRLYRLPIRLNAVAVREGDAWRFVSLHPSYA